MNPQKKGERLHRAGGIIEYLTHNQPGCDPQYSVWGPCFAQSPHVSFSLLRASTGVPPCSSDLSFLLPWAPLFGNPCSLIGRKPSSVCFWARGQSLLCGSLSSLLSGPWGQVPPPQACPMPRGRELEISGSTHGLLGSAPLSWPLMSGVQHSTASRDRGLLAQILGVAANYGARVGSLGD